MERQTQQQHKQQNQNQKQNNFGNINASLVQQNQRPYSNSSHKSDTFKQKRNSHQLTLSQLHVNNLDQLDSKSIKLPEIKREHQNTGGGQPLNQIQQKNSQTSASKNPNQQMQIDNQSTQYEDSNKLNGGAIYASYTAQLNKQNTNTKQRQSLDAITFTSPNQTQQLNIAQVQLSQDIQHQQPVAIGLSYVLNKIKKDRKQTDEEALIMENRIRLLKKEEQKTKKKIEEMKKKSGDIFQIKAKHEKTIQMRGDKEINEIIRIKSAQEQHESIRQKQKEKRFEKISEILLKNHEHYEQVKNEKNTMKQMQEEQQKRQQDQNAIFVRKMRKKQQITSKKIQEQKYNGAEQIIERYQQEIQQEEQRKLQNQLRIQKMEQFEQNLIKKLQKSQIVQHQALLQLQDAIKLKPSDYAAKITSQSMDIEKGKHRLAIKRAQLTDPDPYSSENLSRPAIISYNQVKRNQINQEEHSKSFSTNYANNSTPNKQHKNNEKLNQTYCIDSNFKETDLQNNNLKSSEKQQFSIAQELDYSPEHESREMLRLENQSYQQDKQHQHQQFDDKNKSMMMPQSDEKENKSDINHTQNQNQNNNIGVYEHTEKQQQINNNSKKKELLTRSANDIILQKEVNFDSQATSQHELQDAQHRQIKLKGLENKNRSKSTIKYEITKQHVNQVRGLSSQNDQRRSYEKLEHIERFDTEKEIKESMKRRKKSKKRKNRKSESISTTSQKHLINYSSTNYHLQQMYAYPHINPYFNLHYLSQSNKKNSSIITPIKLSTIPSKPPMNF